VPDAGVKPAGGDPQPQGRVPASAAPWPAVQVGEITGALPPAQPSASTKLASQRPAREPTSDPAARLPNDIGDASLRSAALGGDAAAEYEVGIRFSEGRGIAQNFDNAAFWFTRAADHGLAPAQYRLGSLYEKGQGVKKDIGEARRLYLAAAQQGNAKAMHNLAVLYAVGLDGSPDYKSASGWFQ
jgi:localization factor PodJL